MPFATWISNRPEPRPARLFKALVAAGVLGAHGAGSAAVVVSGTGFTQPGTVLGSDQLWVGSGTGSTGSFVVDAGSAAVYGGLNLAWDRANGSSLVTGSGTTLTLNTNGGRLSVGQWGTADLAVQGGAKILADGNAAACNGACGGNMGVWAGTTATMLISGAGSEVRLRDSFNMATGGVDTALGFGTVGGFTSARLTIEEGGKLVTSGGLTGAFNNSRPGETSAARISITGVNSLWTLVSGSQTNAANRGPFFNLSNSSTNQSFLDITAGGEMRFEGTGNIFSGLNMGSNGGRAQATVSGAGSKLQFNGESGLLQVGRSVGAQASFSVLAGGVVQGAFYTSVGRDGGAGSLVIDGVGSRMTLNNTATAAANGTANVAAFDIARGAGASGTVTVSGGGRLEVLATTARSNGPSLSVSREGGNGTLNITGAGSQVLVSAASVVPAGGLTEAFNPTVNVGRDSGSGILNITAGGQLLVQGNAVSTATSARGTSLNIGGLSDTATSGMGIASISGAGSLLSVTGSDASIRIGRGPGASGQLSVTNQAAVQTTLVNVGRAGMGTLLMDNSTMTLTGQFSSSTATGAVLTVGNVGGTGVANIGNNSTVTLTNMGANGAAVALGGTSVSPKGSGILNLTGGSSITVNAAEQQGRVVVGYDGVGVATLNNGTINVANNGSLTVGQVAGSTGTLMMANNSVINAGFVGVGRVRNADGSTSNGGVGSLIVNSSTINATDIVIGTAGYLGGSGTINGNVTNFGTFNPGNSPGTMVILGNYSAGTGGKLVLEVESDGLGGFVTDQVIFGAGSNVNLNGLTVEFKFLANTNPESFQQSGRFDIDSFLRVQDGSGGTTDLGAPALTGVTYQATAVDFVVNSFSVGSDGSATISAVAVPVPEPGSWALMAGGLMALGAWQRRRGATVPRRA